MRTQKVQIFILFLGVYFQVFAKKQLSFIIIMFSKLSFDVKSYFVRFHFGL